MASNMKIKKGDVVRVISGTDKGAEGKVMGVLTGQGKVLVEGVNRVKRHTKLVNSGGRAGVTGGIITQEAAIDVSNVMLLAEVDGKKVPTRIASKRVETTKTRADGSKYTKQRYVRTARKNGEEI